MITAVERIRELHGMTTKVAKACGVSASTVSEWGRVPTRHIATVARLLEISPAQVRPDMADVLQGLPFEDA
jgi:DNA-binding transcriptional regulator YdaS (Cro superfamily)